MFYDLQASFTKNFSSSADNGEQAIVGAAGTAIRSTNVMDMGQTVSSAFINGSMGYPKRQSLGDNALKNNFDAPHIPLHIQVTKDFAGNTGGLKIDLVNADNEALTTNPVIVYTVTIPLAELKAGKQVAIKELPMGINKRWLGFNFTPLTAASTAGSVDAFITTAKDLPQSL